MLTDKQVRAISKGTVVQCNRAGVLFVVKEVRGTSTTGTGQYVATVVAGSGEVADRLLVLYGGIAGYEVLEPVEAEVIALCDVCSRRYIWDGAPECECAAKLHVLMEAMESAAYVNSGPSGLSVDRIMESARDLVRAAYELGVQEITPEGDKGLCVSST